MALFGLLEVLDQLGVIGWHGLISPTYVSESGAVLLFGIAWLLKGLNLDRALANNAVPLAPPAAPMPAPTAPAEPRDPDQRRRRGGAGGRLRVSGPSSRRRSASSRR